MSLPDWTAGVRVARAFSALKRGESDFEQLADAVNDANHKRLVDEDFTAREGVFNAWVRDGYDIQPDR